MSFRAAARFVWAALFAVVCCPPARADSPESGTIAFTTETLPNGLQVIYAPLHQAPVVHVRVLYHVGSRDERPDRQGFAHMFEHMMFRGSAHVKPEEHMKLVGMVGGYSNAFTSFDQTVYVNTVPSNQLEMCLYLEADRMASFKVNADIFKTERKVVAEEWRMRENRPYGTMYDDFLKNAFIKHSYRWTPIGKMEHLAAAQVGELQEFFNTYYLPNNAVLVIAGDFENDQAKAMVRKYYGWIPKGPDVKRDIPQEPEQTALRDAVAPRRVPLPALMVGYHSPPYASDDNYALSLLAEILGGGRSSRLSKLLVSNQQPLCMSASAFDMTLEDAGGFVTNATMLNGKDPAAARKVLFEAVADIRQNGVSEEELKKAKTAAKVARVKGRETADDLASQLGDEAMFGHDPNRVNSELAKIEAVMVNDIKAMAEKYLRPEQATALLVQPDPLGKAGARDAKANGAEAAAAVNAPVAAEAVKTREVHFPAGYPEHPMIADARTVPEFKKGEEVAVGDKFSKELPETLIVMADNRLPLVSFTIALRHGSHSDKKGKEGTAGLTAEMIRHGTAVQSYQEMNEDLESRGISLGASDSGDVTYINGSCTSEQLSHAFAKASDILLRPRFVESEFEKVKNQTLSGLLSAQESPSTVAEEELTAALWPNTIFGRHPTPASVSAIHLTDVTRFFQSYYHPSRDTVVIFSGDVTAEKAKELAGGLLKEWQPGDAPPPDYPKATDAAPAARKIILVDNPGAPGVHVAMGILAYDIHNEDKFAGSLAGQILTAGIDSRLGKYVRAEKGLVYGIHGVFAPNRHYGTFEVGTDTRPDAAGETVEATFHVLEGMRNENVTDKELSEAKLRVSGSMAMRMQTIQQQATMRVDAILNGYPVNYYDKLPTRILAVTADQVRQVVQKYVRDNQMVIVVVGPADAIKGQLEKIGPVQVVPMPAKRQGATAKPANELLKPAA